MRGRAVEVECGGHGGSGGGVAYVWGRPMRNLEEEVSVSVKKGDEQLRRNGLC